MKEATPTIARGAVLAACADMIRACGLTLAELAQALGEPAGPAVHIVVRPPAVRALSENDRRVIEAAGKADGVTVSDVIDLLGLRDAQAHRYCALLTKAGHLTGVKKPGVRAMRFFSSPTSAQAWANDTAAAAAPSPSLAEHCTGSVALSADEIRSTRIHAAKVRGAKASPPPMGARTKRVQPGRPGADMLVKGGTVSPPPPAMPKAAREPIITSDTKITLDTTRRPTARWQMQQEAPDERWPSFAAARPGIDPSTGKAWEARA